MTKSNLFAIYCILASAKMHVVVVEPIGSGASLVVEGKKMGHFVTVVSANVDDRQLRVAVLGGESKKFAT